MRLLLLLAALLAASPAAAACDPADRGEPFEVAAEPLDLGPADWRGLELLGAVRLSSEHGALGGLSGLLVEQGGSRLVAVGDRGWWFTFEVARTASGAVGAITAATEHRMRGPRGRLEGDRKDAEGITRRGDDIFISFERVHRVLRCAEGSRVGSFEKLEPWAELGNNEGLEALATLPDGRLIAIAEAEASVRGFPYWVFGTDAEPVTGFLPQTDRHRVTGADAAPDGTLYVLERDYSVLRGVSIRVVRYRPGDDGLPRPETQELLVQLDSDTGIDNMEGIALWTDAEGRLRLTLLSDDNFSPVQRTLLVDTVVRRP